MKAEWRLKLVALPADCDFLVVGDRRDKIQHGRQFLCRDRFNHTRREKQHVTVNFPGADLRLAIIF
ncbi:MAG: hypothetical protein ACJ8E6_10855, partial [Sphingomicrobium sp.]